MNKKIILISVVIIIVLIAIGGFWYLQKQPEQQKYTGPVEKVTLASNFEELSSLIWIAKEKGYFQEQGIDLEVVNSLSGVESADKLAKNEVDLALMSEFVVVGESLQNIDLQIIASAGEMTIQDIVANSDSGINKIADLKNKKIGLQLKTSPEFWLAQTLIVNEISLNEVKLVDIKVSDLPEALAKGDVDAIAIWQSPNEEIAQNLLGNKAIVFSNQFGKDTYWLLCGKKEYINENKEKAQRILKALIKAEKFIKENPEESKEIIMNKLGMKKDYLDRVWGRYDFNVNLHQSLILMMEDQARWKVKTLNQTQIPNYFNYIYIDALEQVNPDAITIIR